MSLFSKNKTENKSSKGDHSVGENAVSVASGPKLPEGGDALSYSVILAPYITEKATMVSSQNQYIFKVADGASKNKIKTAVESLYEVRVSKVRISRGKAKIRMTGRRIGHKPGFKKALVTLKEGSKIDIAA
ncbi:MAG TPA: 50S ribosomal protein L23 [Candidatus Paceibacterota bacterium]